MFKQKRNLSEVVLHLKDKPTDQIDAIASNLLEALADLLGDTVLRGRFVKSFHLDNKLAQSQRAAFANLMQDSIRLCQFLKTRLNCEQQAPSYLLEVVKLTSQVSQSADRVMSNIFKLLPTVDLIKCAETLLEQNEDEVCIALFRFYNALTFERFAMLCLVQSTLKSVPSKTPIQHQ
jgi:U3 small nucleolar RNA-associated protein 10